MARRPLVLVSATLAVALTVLVVAGLRVLERDRRALLARYGHERQQGIEEAVRGLGSEIVDIGDDLELASTLLRGATSEELAERELHAIATIKREYLVMYARTDAGATTKVTAFDVPAGVAARSDETLHRLLRIAIEQPGKLHVSGAYAAGPREAWYRVFARRPKDSGPVVAVVVDTAVLLTRMKLQRDAMSRIAVLDANGVPAPSSDTAFASLARERPAMFRPLLATVLNDEHGNAIIEGDIARRLGLPNTPAVLVGVPLVVDNGPPWSLIVAASTQALQTQERTIVRRVLVGSGLILVLLFSAAAYVLHNTFRARALRERVSHTERLAHLTEKAEKILDHIPSGVLALSEDGHVTGVNRWLAARIGGDVIGQQLGSAFPGGSDDVASVVSLFVRAKQTGQPQLLHRDETTLLGREASLNIRAVPLAHGVGDVSVLVVFDDLTEVKRIEQRLLHSEKLVTAGQLAAGIAHEIGTPLNVARGRVELSLSHLGNDHREADNQRVVMDQIDRVTRLIQQLLDYVRPAPSAMREVDLAHALHVVKDLLAAQATKRRVSLDVDVASDATTLRADPDQVQQIVMNLTLNAIDACEPGGKVIMRTATRGGTFVLEIVDNGHGIPRELQKQVFDPFFTTKKRGQGTGLGLWVVAQLVRAHAAEIEVDSMPGRGTTVRVAWPVHT